MNLLLSAGEASGDLHGARLLRALQAGAARYRRFRHGGRRLEAAGLERIVASEALSVVGITEVFEKLPALRRALEPARRGRAARRPEAAVLIDFPDFHALLSRRLRRDGVPLHLLRQPAGLGLARRRARASPERARRIITLFPFEAEIYRRLGADAVCAGHPLVEDVREGLAATLPAAAEDTAPARPPARAAASPELAPPLGRDARRRRRLGAAADLDAVAVRAPGLSAGLFAGAAESRDPRRRLGTASRPRLGRPRLRRLRERRRSRRPCAALRWSSSTARRRSSHAIARALVKLRWISLVNIVGGEEVVPELLQDDVDRREPGAGGRSGCSRLRPGSRR